MNIGKKDVIVDESEFFEELDKLEELIGDIYESIDKGDIQTTEVKLKTLKNVRCMLDVTFSFGRDGYQHALA